MPRYLLAVNFEGRRRDAPRRSGSLRRSLRIQAVLAVQSVRFGPLRRTRLRDGWCNSEVPLAPGWDDFARSEVRAVLGGATKVVRVDPLQIWSPTEAVLTS
jgi:hypothetical protein